jgi:hypothetical protein
LTDNRLHAWEWLLTEEGDIIKTDAIDHCAGHDLIGPQDIEWDVVGAIVEFDLSQAEIEILLTELARCTDYRPDSLRRCFYGIAYLAFQLGYYVLAAQNESEAERAALEKRAEFYRSRLRALIEAQAT